MSQFSIYKNTNKNSRKAYPYFIDVQNDFLDGLNSRVVIPLSPYNKRTNNSVTYPRQIITVKGDSFVMLSHQITSIPGALLKKKVASVEHFKDEILGAIDFFVAGI